MKILGIDPGSTSMGFAVIEERGSTIVPLIYGTTAIKSPELAEKLLRVRQEVLSLLKKYRPNAIGIEKLFFSKNKKTAFEVAQARGAILVTLKEAGVAIYEFTPGEIKIAVTNYGSADKEMVRKMVCRLLNIAELNGDDNASDALAVAITASNKARLANR